MKKYKSKRRGKYKTKAEIKPVYIIFLGILIIFLSTILFNKDRNKLDIPIENISNLKISSEDIIQIHTLSQKYNLDFVEMLTYYCVENKFFKEKSFNTSSIEQNFIINYEKIKSKYKQKDIEPYYRLIDGIIKDIKSFPIDLEYMNEYIYGDTFGAMRTYGGERPHLGTDIMDRENIDGRIPIISMTNGTIENIGWNEKGGYRIGIRSTNEGYYYYAHFDSYADGLEKGTEIQAGQILGYMGSTGYSKEEGTKGRFETHLHFGIEINTELQKEPIWINPYPFLSLIEYNSIEALNK